MDYFANGYGRVILEVQNHSTSNNQVVRSICQQKSFIYVMCT